MPHKLLLSVKAERMLLACLCLGVGLCYTADLLAQPVRLSPRAMGFDIPDSDDFTVGMSSVVTADQSGQVVVAKVYVQLGPNRIVMLPDGELVARGPEQVTETERPFEAATPETVMTRLAAELGGDFKFEKTRNYVYAYNCSAAFAAATSRILESMRPGVTTYVERMGVPTSAPDVVLMAILFRTEAEFQNYRRMPDGVVAYYDILTNRIVMYEESPLFRAHPQLATQQAISTIAHEGAHQILHNIGLQKRLSSWPIWLSEGLAEYLAPTTFGRGLKWKGAGQINDLRMLELELYIKSRTAGTPSGQLVEDTVSAARLTSTGYAAAWSLTHWLASRHREKFFEYVRELSTLQPLEAAGPIVEPGIVPAHVRLFQTYFGDDFVTLETQLVGHLKKQPYRDPFAEYPHYVATLSARDGRRELREANIFHSHRMADVWLSESVRKLPDPARASAQIRVVEFPNRPVAEQAARQFLGR